MTEEKQEPGPADNASPMVALLQRWLAERRDTISERPPGPEDEDEVGRQLAVLAAERLDRGVRRRGSRAAERGNSTIAAAALAMPAVALWRALHGALERGPDLFGDDAEALSILVDETGVDLTVLGSTPGVPGAAALLALVRDFLAPEEECRLTPEAFGARVRREPPAGLELPDGVELRGASLAGFLESAHFPFGEYRVLGSPTVFFVTPSLRLGAVELESLVRTGPGQRRVGRELLVWRPASFRIAAGAAAEARDARPFVGPSGARAYLWLGRALPGGPLVLRDANNVEERVPLPEDLLREDGRRQTEAKATQESVGLPSPVSRLPSAVSAPQHPALARAERALHGGENGATVEHHLREVMRDPRASGETLAGAGRLWQVLGRPDAARAAFTMALEHGCVEGALGLSRLAEAAGEGPDAAARPLDAAVARNLRSAELHARYAELLERVPFGRGPLAEWHRRQAEELIRGE